MSRPDPIQYAERLYGAIRAANFSPISFLAFGNAVKEGVALRNMTRIAAEPFMRVVGEMLDLEEEAAQAEDDDLVEAEVIVDAAEPAPNASAAADSVPLPLPTESLVAPTNEAPSTSASPASAASSSTAAEAPSSNGSRRHRRDPDSRS